MSRRLQLEKMLATDGNDPFLHYALALEFQKEGNHAAALEKLAEVVARFPNYVAAYFRQGQIFSEDGEPERAAAVLKQGIAVARTVGDLHAAGEMQGLLELVE